MRTKSLFLTLLITLCALPLAAQLESGKVYRFVNKADTNIAMAAVSTSETYGVAIKENDYAQLWLVEQHPSDQNGWALRSLGNGLYLRATGTSTVWSYGNTPAQVKPLYCVETGGGYYTFNVSNGTTGGNCMHYATSQGGAVVGWNTGADATHWKIVNVEVSQEDLEANWAELDAFNNLLTAEFKKECQTALDNLFEDAACTKLKKSYANVAALEADANYKTLPEPLKLMAKKVYTGDWSEANFDSSKPSWDSEHAKRFRIQSIEPYSIAGQITDWFGINAHANMDNPTGLFANARQHIYVIVDGEIADGAELYLGSLNGHGLLATYENGVKLNKGLNIIPFSGNGNSLYINYVVHTYNTSTKKFLHKLSDFANITVHIEGGNINGYYNAVGDHLWGEPDDDDDWQYYEDRATLESATILGKRQILHFRMQESFLVTGEDGNWTTNGLAYYLPNNIEVPAGTPAKQKVNKLMEAWDRIHLSELATMGLLSKHEMDSLNALYPRYDEKWQKAGNIYDYNENFYNNQDGRDYSEYFNHHGIAYGNFSGYMSGGWRNCNYNHNTMGDIIGKITTQAGPAWGPAHEIGHQHQSIFTVNGLTEVTNNMHSNIAVWYMGLGTSRVNGTSGNLASVYKNYKAGEHFLFHHVDDGSQNLWSQTQMFYRLWLYYHRCGNNTQFYPRMFEMLRGNRLSSNALGTKTITDENGSSVTAAYTNGTNSTLRLYEVMCDAAQEDLTEFFRAYGFFALLNDKLRGDYSNSIYVQTQKEVDASIARVKAKGYKENIVPLFTNDCVNIPTYGHDGKTRRSLWDGETGQGKNATLGMYTDVMKKSVKAEGYLYTLSSGTVKILYDTNSKGALGFVIYDAEGNMLAFTDNYSVSLPATAGSDIAVYAVQADGTKVKVLTAAEGGDEEQQLSALKSAIASAKTLLNYVTENGSKAGYYYKESVEELQSLLAKAQAAIDNADQSEYTYGVWATKLTQEISNLTNDKYSKVNIKEKNIYTLDYRQGYLAFYNGAVKAASAAQVPASSDDRKWEFVSTGVENEFYIKNVGQGKYITSISNNQEVTMTSIGTTSAVKFIVRYGNDGLLTFLSSDDTGIAINARSNKSIVGYSSEDQNSKWRVTIVEENAKAHEAATLAELTSEATRVIDEIGSADGESVTINENIANPAENLATLLAELNSANNEAIENKETAIDLARYIDKLSEALANIDGKYILTPAEGEMYYIKDIEADKFCGIETESTNANYKTSVSLTELAKDDKNLWWRLEATGNQGEYKIYNVGQEKYLYSNTRGYIKADGAQEADVYTVTLDKENNALLIADGNKFWYNGLNNYASISRSSSPWRIMKIGAEQTGIEQITTEQQAGDGAIYDLYGRKIETITNSGIYIVNGKKVLVK